MAPVPGLMDQVLALEQDPALAPQFVGRYTRRARPPELVPIPSQLAPELHRLLQARGIDQLYAHQGQAVELALAGQHTVVVSPASSGKSLCYLLPVLEALLQRQRGALLLFPTKALAHDQLKRIADYLQQLGLDPDLVAVYDGDTPSAGRSAARGRARLLITNPDMLHVGILPNHVRWRELLSALDYIVLDEMHSYRGVFGSHVASVLWRLRRLCAFYGSSPRFVCTSATVANPGELARTLVGEDVTLVDHSGAPEPDRHLMLYNPPVIDQSLGLRRSPLEDSRLLVQRLLMQRLQTVCFTRSRLDVERLVLALRQDAPRAGLSPQAVRGYRAGYTGNERRAIEAGLRDGSVQCVVATSALELGIDIGSLAACVLVGYPGNASSMWQRIGRVGRGPGGGLAILVAAESPLDQYLLAHPDILLGAGSEAVLVNGNNLHVRVGHMQCALYEMPLDGERLADVQGGAAIMRALEGQGLARQSGGRWYWSSSTYPAADVSLRTAGARRVEIVRSAEASARGVSIGQVEASDAPRWVHPEAVYLHEGTQYLVRSLDLEAGVALVDEVALPFITVASERTAVQVEQVLYTTYTGALTRAFGDIRVTSQVVSYRREDLENHQVLSRAPLDMPEQTLLTQACWLAADQALIERLCRDQLWMGEQPGGRGPNWLKQRSLALERDGHRCRRCGASELGRTHDVHHVVPFASFGWVPGENDAYLIANRLDNLLTLCPRCHRQAEQQVAINGTLADAGYLLRHLVPLWVLCDPGDIGTHTEVVEDSPTLYIYDRASGGSGIAASVYQIATPLLEAARDRVHLCDCEGGCPSCIGPALAVQPERKRRALSLLSGLLGQV